MKNIFDSKVVDETVERINRLTPETQPQWGKMDAAQMLAHCNVTYQMIFSDKQEKIPWLKKLILKKIVKPIVVGDKPYKHNSRTAPAFLIADKREYDKEKNQLIANIRKVQKKGASYFEGKASPSFGVLTTREWNNMMYKHLDHHLGQFGI